MWTPVYPVLFRSRLLLYCAFHSVSDKTMKFCFVVLIAPLLALCKVPRSLVVWHGLGEFLLLIGLELGLTDSTGDSYNSTGMLEFQELVKQVHPGIFVHSVYIDRDLENDRRAGFVSEIRKFLLADI